MSSAEGRGEAVGHSACADLRRGPTLVGSDGRSTTVQGVPGIGVQPDLDVLRELTSSVVPLPV